MEIIFIERAQYHNKKFLVKIILSESGCQNSSMIRAIYKLDKETSYCHVDSGDFAVMILQRMPIDCQCHSCPAIPTAWAPCSSHAAL